MSGWLRRSRPRGHVQWRSDLQTSDLRTIGLERWNNRWSRSVPPTPARLVVLVARTPNRQVGAAHTVQPWTGPNFRDTNYQRRGGAMARYRVSMDIGGTFTDVVTYDDSAGVFAASKASTTPGNLSAGVLAGLDAVVDDRRRHRFPGSWNHPGSERLPGTARGAGAATGHCRSGGQLSHRPRTADSALRLALPQARHRSYSAEMCWASAAASPPMGPS